MAEGLHDPALDWPLQHCCDDGTGLRWISGKGFPKFYQPFQCLGLQLVPINVIRLRCVECCKPRPEITGSSLALRQLTNQNVHGALRGRDPLSKTLSFRQNPSELRSGLVTLGGRVFHGALHLSTESGKGAPNHIGRQHLVADPIDDDFV